jgi:FixJ family two-component response regulator
VKGSRRSTAPDKRLQSTKPLIALVDADRAVCQSIQRLVVSRGIDADIFTSARDFITAIESIPWFIPDCVVMSTQLSELNGFDALERMGRSRPHTPVIYVTGAREDARPRVAVASQAVAFFEKPLDLDRFLETLLDILAIRSNARAAKRTPS